MSVTESRRRQIFVKLKEAHGEQVADDLMNLLPLKPTSELVTRDDLAATTMMLRGEMAELRGEMAELRAEVRTEIAGLQRWMMGVMAANAIAVVAALIS